MLDPSKRMGIIPIEGIVEACLDYTPEADMYSLRIEGLDERIVLMCMDEGAKPFLALFDKFIDECIELREAVLNLD